MRFFRFAFTALILLSLTSGCAGIEPLFGAGNAPRLTPPTYEPITLVNRHNDNFGYIPTSSEENGLTSLNKKRYKFSVFLPNTVKFEF